MKWNKIIPNIDRTKIRDQLPKDRPFIALWKGAFCLCEYDNDLDRFIIGIMPAMYLGFWKVDPERECKFTYWAELDLPEDY